MLNVVLISGDRMDNIYTVLEPVDSGVGAHCGLAHWNGTSWKWVRRFDHAYAGLYKMKYINSESYILHDEGSILIIDANGEQRTLPKPRIKQLCGNRLPEWNRFFSFELIAAEKTAIVGDGGAFFIYEKDCWHHVETYTQNKLSYIVGTIPNCLICGTDGLVLRYDGVTCHRLHDHEGDFPADIDCNESGTYFISFARRDQNGGLLSIDSDTIQRIALGMNIGSIGCFSYQAIYVCDGNGTGLYLWRGDVLEKQLPGVYGPRAKINGTLCFGTGAHPDGGDAIYYGPPFGPKISIDLDPEFLQ